MHAAARSKATSPTPPQPRAKRPDTQQSSAQQPSIQPATKSTATRLQQIPLHIPNIPTRTPPPVTVLSKLRVVGPGCSSSFVGLRVAGKQKRAQSRGQIQQVGRLCAPQSCDKAREQTRVSTCRQATRVRTRSQARCWPVLALCMKTLAPSKTGA